jgi:hypothetical protein
MAKSSGGISSGSSGASYSGGGGLSGMGRASSAPIGGLGQVAGTASSGWGGATAPTYGGGYTGRVGDSRTFAGLSPQSQAYMQAGSPGSYYNYLHGGAGTGGGEGPQNMATWQDMLGAMFMPQQSQQPRDYSRLFANSQVNLESPTMMARPTEQPFANKPSFSNINPYGGV